MARGHPPKAERVPNIEGHLNDYRTAIEQLETAEEEAEEREHTSICSTG